MKLWDLSVKLNMKSTGAAEREALQDIADMIGVRGKHRLLFDERGVQHIYVVTGDLMEEAEIRNLWQIERMLHEAYGIEFRDVGKAAVEGIVQGVKERYNPNGCADKDVALALRKTILRTLDMMPTNLADRSHTVDMLDRMVRIYLSFCKEAIDPF